ncbi:hypothetical protein PVMG_05952 [Plasmodium vivax Mauritania I]|uniref:Variable surface protein Vir35 n=1 Tax=Plasmodium vivax Mauritania I TaxID=1035515 RepID=A0A0J9W447_PLAVI|nr:hypothetical protein PVMG_05952 [Plasmodium vivax Mauritania I]
MVLLNNCNLRKNVMLSGFLKIFTFTFLIWTYHPYNDLGKFPKSLEDEDRPDKMLNPILNRSLAKHDLHSELHNRELKDKLSVDRLNKNGRNMLGDISTYSEVKRKESNNLEVYMKNYKDRYAKKKGISKLDCYCEKKVFDKFLHIKELSEKVHNDKKRFKKIFLKKYGIGLIFFALIPALGFIYPILFGIEEWKLDGVFPFCKTDGHTKAKAHLSPTKECPKWHDFQLEEPMKYINPLNSIFSFTMITIILTFLIYIIIKLIKYEKLKAGKGKMNLMEYCRFCKDVFI